MCAPPLQIPDVCHQLIEKVRGLDLVLADSPWPRARFLWTPCLVLSVLARNWQAVGGVQGVWYQGP